MKVVFLADVSDEAQRQVVEIIKDLMRQLKVPLEAVDAILIASESRYGESITALEPGAAFTQSSEYTGFGKTIPRRADGVTRSSIVLREELVKSTSIQRGKSVPPFVREMCRYVMAHELGHALDNTKRTWVKTVLPRVDEQFSLRKVADYYHQILLSEFAACALAGPAMTRAVFKHEVGQFATELANTSRRLRDEKAQYDAGDLSLFSLAHSAAGRTWFLLIQYAKLVGSLQANQALGELREALPAAPDLIGRIVQEFSDDLADHWTRYPAWEDWTPQVVLPIWSDLAGVHGFGFEETPEGDLIHIDL